MKVYINYYILVYFLKFDKMFAYMIIKKKNNKVIKGLFSKLFTEMG